ncbi:MAG: hypothetical protein WC637_05645 [Victivallales bacterium]|jgi:hypothetical protein
MTYDNKVDMKCELVRGKLSSPALNGKDVSYTLYAPAGMERGATLPMVVYMVNLPVERLGTTTDEELINGFLADGMMVTVVDYGKKDMGSDGRRIHDEFVWLYTMFGGMRDSSFFDRASVQGRDRVFMGYNTAILTIKSLSGMEVEVDPDWIYVIPEGCTIVRDVEVMRLPYLPPRNRIRMDLMIPAKPKQPVPLLLELSPRSTDATSREMTLFCASTPSTMSYSYFGYATAIMGFVYEEPLPGEALAYGRDFSEHKAIRMLRARKQEWGLSGKIGMLGGSKCATRVLLAAAKRTGQKSTVTEVMADRYPYSVFYRGFVPEWMTRDYEDVGKGIFPFKPSDAYKGIPEERNLGPYAGENDCPDVIHCGAIGIPTDLPYVVPYLTDKLPPIIFSTGNEDGWVGWRPGQICAKLLRDALQTAGVKNLLYNEQEGLGHAFNHIRFDEFKAFFDAEVKNV